MLSRTAARSLVAIKKSVDFARSLHPAARAKVRARALERERAFGVLDQYSRGGGNAPASKRVLVDGSWYNPNFWLRYALFRRALSLSEVSEVGMLGVHARAETRQTLDLFGINERVDLGKRIVPAKFIADARALLRGVTSPDDIMALQLPDDFPAAALYDGLLKRQRRSAVDIDDPLLVNHIAEFLAWSRAGAAIIEDGGFDLLAMSHAIDFTYLAVVWRALKKGIPVVVLYGDYSTSRFIRMEKPEDIYAYPVRPTQQEEEAMSPEGRESLRATGARYLDNRLSGHTLDVGAIYAYQRRTLSIDSAGLAEQFGWDPAKPVVGVYAPNWFDYPHATGFPYFRDFLDWIELTLDVATRTTGVNWLFKSHPCDDWYASIRGSRVEDLVQATNRPNIRAADKSWNGADIIQTIDAVVTCHGTIGIEAAYAGKPVLVAHKGWYGRNRFTKVSETREAYAAHLETEWWKTVNVEAHSLNAARFAGWYFNVPDWNSGLVYRDDSEQDAILPTIPSFLDANAEPIEREVAETRAWFDSRHPYFHIFKNARASSFQAVTDGLVTQEPAA